MADGTLRLHERDLYRCYRKISAPQSCAGQSSYHVEPINETVEAEVRKFLAQIGSIPEKDLLELASSKKQAVCEVAMKQAQKDYETAKKQVDALEEQAIKALTGENQLDLSVVNSMLIKHKARMEEAMAAMEDTEAQMSAAERNTRATRSEIEEIRNWAEHYDEITVEAKHMVIARLVDRIEVGKGYEINIRMKVAMEQLIEKTA